MKPKVLSRYLSYAVFTAILSIAPICAEEQKTVEIHLSEVELKEIFDNPTRSYVYVGAEVSDIAAIMQEMSKLDENPNSLIKGLVEHVKRGFNIGNYDAVAQALEEAEQLLIKHADALGEEKTAALSKSLDTIIEQVIEEKLNLDAELLAFLKDSVAQGDETKGCCKPQTHCHGLRLLVVKEKVDFLGKVKFKNDVTFKDDVTFEDPATFEDNVVIEGTLSVTDLVVLSCMDSLCVNTLSVTDLIIGGGSCFDSLCVTNLSVVDESVSGTLSVTDIIAANGTVSGTLSVGDLVASTIDDLCNLTVGCNIIMVDSTDASHGNIFKSDAPFVHNFGINNTFMGLNSGNFTTSGFGGNTAVGANTLSAITTAETNTAVGSNALVALTTGISNIAVGANALNATTTPNYNIAVGSNTLLINTTGTRNVAIGDAALSGNVTGSFNVGIGKDALFSSTNNNNTAIGDFAGFAITTGTNIIALGSGAGGTVTTGSNDIYIGASAAAAAESATTRIGTAGTQTRCFIAGITGVTTGGAAVAVLVDGNGQLGTVSSSATRKHAIKDMKNASAAIYKLRPVTFVYNGDETETMQYGLIAEEVNKVFPEIVVNNKAGKPETVQYHVLPALLLNELQKLAARVAALEAAQG